MNTKFDQRRARALTFMLSLGMLAGVLIWAKLRLVTDIPRSALAVPEEVEGAEGVDGGNDQLGEDPGRTDAPGLVENHGEHQLDD